MAVFAKVIEGNFTNGGKLVREAGDADINVGLQPGRYACVFCGMYDDNGVDYSGMGNGSTFQGFAKATDAKGNSAPIPAFSIAFRELQGPRDHASKEDTNWFMVGVNGRQFARANRDLATKEGRQQWLDSSEIFEVDLRFEERRVRNSNQTYMAKIWSKAD